MRTMLPEAKSELLAGNRLNLGTLVPRELQDTQFRPLTGWMFLSWHPTTPAHAWSSRVTPTVGWAALDEPGSAGHMGGDLSPM